MNAVHFQVTDILTQIFNTFLVTEIRNNRRRCSPSLALLYVQFVWFGCNCLIGTDLRIEIRECDSRNFEIACGIAIYSIVFVPEVPAAVVLMSTSTFGS